MGGLKDELLKAIWHAFTALDLDHSGKVSKSQLMVGATPPPLSLRSPTRPRPGARSTAPASGDPKEGRAGMRPGGLLWAEGPETRILLFCFPLAFRPCPRVGC